MNSKPNERLTITGFLRLLRAQTVRDKIRWRVQRGQIRNRYGHCPIIVVGAPGCAPGATFVEMAQSLGLSDEDTTSLINAADYDWKYLAGYSTRVLRRRLLRACQIAEPRQARRRP